ncbi:MAG: biotin/lipoyl-binding protein [Dehalococcoidia bacterium]|nr:biotin/lipoyl-binding protein [Dehalococcoidia bacterium]
MATRHRLLLDGEERTVVVDEAGDQVTVTVGEGEPLSIDVTTSGIPGTFSLVIDGQPAQAYVTRRGQGFEVTVDGRRFLVGPATGGGRQRGGIGGKDRLGEVTAPLAGVVVDVRVAVGDRFSAGQTLLVIEAMKMQNEIQAPHDGTVKAIHCERGGRVEQGALVLEYDADGTETAS